MCGHRAGRITEVPDRALIVGHSGIVQQDHVGRAAARALVVIRRRPDLCDDGGFGTQFGCSHTCTVFAGAESEFWQERTTRRARLCRNSDARQATAAAAAAKAIGPAWRRPDRYRGSNCPRTYAT